MRPSAPLKEILVVYKETRAAMKHGSFTFENDRMNHWCITKMEDGLLKYRLIFTKEGKLDFWERFQYLQVNDTFSATVEAGKYHEIKFLDGEYCSKQVGKLVKGIKVEKLVDTEVPGDV